MPASEESTRRAVSLRHATSRRPTLSVFIAAPRSGRDPLCSPGTLQRGCPRQVADPRALPTAASVTGRQRAWRPLSPRRQRSSSSSEDPPGTRRGEVQLEGECEPLDRGAGCSEREALAGWVPWSDSGRQMQSSRWSVADAVPSKRSPACGSPSSQQSEAGRTAGLGAALGSPHPCALHAAGGRLLARAGPALRPGVQSVEARVSDDQRELRILPHVHSVLARQAVV